MLKICVRPLIEQEDGTYAIGRHCYIFVDSIVRLQDWPTVVGLKVFTKSNKCYTILKDDFPTESFERTNRLITNMLAWKQSWDETLRNKVENG